MAEELKKEDLNEAALAGGSTYDCDWLITCPYCRTQFTIYGFHQTTTCPKCRNLIYLVHGEGNPQSLN